MCRAMVLGAPSTKIRVATPEPDTLCDRSVREDEREAVALRHVIIGNGIAGVEAAGAIRALDPDSSLTIIARETFPPYCRPMISLVLAGTATLE